MNKEQNDVITIDLVDEVFKIMNDENFKTFYKNNLVHYKDGTCPENRKYQELICLYKAINQDRYDKPYTDVVSFDNDNNIILTNEIIKTPKVMCKLRVGDPTYYIQPIDTITNKVFSSNNNLNYFTVNIQNKKSVKIEFALFRLIDNTPYYPTIDNMTDRVIFNAICSFWGYGVKVIPINKLYEVANNGSRLQYNTQYQQLIESLERLKENQIAIDTKNRLKQLKINHVNENIKGSLVSYNFELNKENKFRSTIEVLAIPLYQYATLGEVNHLLSRPFAEKKKSSFKSFKQNAIEDFFMRRIYQMQKVKNKKFTNVILLESMLSEFDIIEEYKSDKRKAYKIRKEIEKVLHVLTKTHKVLKKYEFIKERQEIKKIELFF